jgi:hypothetical protein
VLKKLMHDVTVPSAAEAVIKNRALIAAVNRCATQKQERKADFSAKTVKR